MKSSLGKTEVGQTVLQGIRGGREGGREGGVYSYLSRQMDRCAYPDTAIRPKWVFCRRRFQITVQCVGGGATTTPPRATSFGIACAAATAAASSAVAGQTVHLEEKGGETTLCLSW